MNNKIDWIENSGYVNDVKAFHIKYVNTQYDCFIVTCIKDAFPEKEWIEFTEKTWSRDDYKTAKFVCESIFRCFSYRIKK